MLRRLVEDGLVGALDFGKLTLPQVKALLDSDSVHINSADDWKQLLDRIKEKRDANKGG